MFSHYLRLSNLKWKENEWYSLVPFGDIHYGSPDHDSNRYPKFIKRCVEKANTLVVGMGDYNELMSHSERRHWRQTEWHDGTVFRFEERVKELVEEHCRILRPLAESGRLLGLTEGNHYYRFEHMDMGILRGKTSTEYMCDLLKVLYMGEGEFMLRVAVPNARKGAEDLKVTMLGHHGVGGGSGKDKGMNHLRNMCGYYPGVDIFLMGHVHRKAVDRDICLVQGKPVNGSNQMLPIHHQVRVLARTGTFLKGFNQNRITPSYMELRGYPPTDLGVINIAMCWKRSQENGKDRTWLDLHPSL